MLLMAERRDLILQELIKEGSVYVSELAKKYSVTYETIRKDLTYLENKGILFKYARKKMLIIRNWLHRKLLNLFLIIVQL